DSPSLGEEITSGDAFLSGISSCGVNLVEAAAQETGVTLHRIEVTIDGIRLRSNPTSFEKIELRFILTGPSQEQAEALVQRYEDLGASIRARGVALESIGASTNLLDPELRRRFVKLVAIADALGAPAITTGSGGLSDDPDAFGQVVTVAREIARVAADHGVR